MLWVDMKKGRLFELLLKLNLNVKVKDMTCYYTDSNYLRYFMEGRWNDIGSKNAER